MFQVFPGTYGLWPVAASTSRVSALCLWVLAGPPANEGWALSYLTAPLFSTRTSSPCLALLSWKPYWEHRDMHTLGSHHDLKATAAATSWLDNLAFSRMFLFSCQLQPRLNMAGSSVLSASWTGPGATGVDTSTPRSK
eukprot:scaffold435_cov342-Pavlova_lutheri.AAC.43